MKKTVQLNDIKRQANIYRDIIKDIYDTFESRLHKTETDGSYGIMFISLNYMMKVYNLLKDIHCLLDSKRTDRANATLRSLIELQVFIHFHMFHQDSILAYHDHYIFHHIQDIKDILSTTPKESPNYNDIKKELEKAKNEMNKCIEKYGTEFNRPLGWASIYLEGKPNLTLPKLMRELNLPEQMLIIYRSLHKYVHLGNFNIERDMIDHLKDFTKVNTSVIDNLVVLTFEYGSTILLTLSVLLSAVLTSKGYQKEADRLLKHAQKLNGINNHTSVILDEALKMGE